jgi:CubicO group peptidase (beta-lactamase class C family)
MTGVTLTTTEIPREADRAAGHTIGKGGKVESMAEYVIRDPNPSGSVNASARDLAAWLKFHLATGVGPAGVRLVSVKNLSETHTPQNLIPMRGSARELNPDTVQLTYAMGWLVYDYHGKKVISHGGMIDGFRVQLTFLPEEDLGFAVLCNLHDTRMTLALTNSLIDRYCGLEPRDWNRFYRKIVDETAAERKRSLEARDRARDPRAKPSLPTRGYLGSYSHPAYGTAQVAEKAGQLSLMYGNFTCPLTPFEGDTFRITDGFFEEQIVAFTVEKGKPVKLSFQGQVFVRK